MKLKIKKGDIVEIISGNDKGKTGRVMQIYASKMQLLIEGVNIRKKHKRPTQADQKGGIRDMEIPIHYSNVLVIDSDKKASRIGIRMEEKEGKNVRARYAISNGKDL